MKAKELEKIAKKYGWVFDRQKGSHKLYKHPNSTETVNIPNHGPRDLTPGVLNDELKKIRRAQHD